MARKNPNYYKESVACQWIRYAGYSLVADYKAKQGTRVGLNFSEVKLRLCSKHGQSESNMSCGRNARRKHYCERYFIVHWAELSDKHKCLKQYDDHVVAQAKAELERFEYEEMTGFDGTETPETPPVDGVSKPNIEYMD